MRLSIIVRLIIGIDFLAPHARGHRPRGRRVRLLEVEVGVIEMFYEEVDILWYIGYMSVAEGSRENDGLRRGRKASFVLLHVKSLAQGELWESVLVEPLEGREEGG